MPLFFFISGFLSYANPYNLSVFARRVKNRLTKQLYPTFVILALYLLLTHEGLSKLFAPFDTGYWFTCALVQVFLAYAIIALVVSQIKMSSSQNLILWVLIFCFFAICAFAFMYFELMQNNFMELIFSEQSIFYSQFFFFGIVCKIMKDSLFFIISKRISFITLAILFAIICSLEYNAIVFGISRYIGMLMILSLFYIIEQRFKPDGFLGNQLRLAGRNTLPIYLTHYFIIHVLATTDCSFLTDIFIKYPIVEMLTTIALAVAITYTVLYFDIFFKRCLPKVHKLVYWC